MALVPFTGSKWGDSAAPGTNGGTVTWSFNLQGAQFYSYDASIDSAFFRTWVRDAFDTWERVADINFVEVATAAADIQIGLDAFDGRGGTLGEARWSYSGGLTIHAEIAIDTAEYWGPTAYGGSNFYALVVHEIGHTIGLGHTDDAGSIMYPYLGFQNGLTAIDVASIQTLYGAPGLTFYGTSASETLTGNAGNNTIYGYEGNDLVYGLEGRDVIYGAEGNDTVTGNQGNDTVYGGFGNDLVYGGQNDDLVLGNQGDDTVTGNQGNDTVYGGLGNDLVYGGQGDDIVYGNQGRDTLHGGVGNDTLIGGEEADLFMFGIGDGNDIITDFRASEGDRLSLGGQSYSVSEVGGSAVLNLSGGGTITLLGVTAATFEPAALV